MAFCVYILALVLGLYLVLAVGVNLIASLAPIPAKPLLNAILLGVIVIGFLCAVATRAVSH